MAKEPIDPRLEPVPIFADQLVGIGVCAGLSPSPSGGSATAPARIVDVRRLEETTRGSLLIDLGRPMAITAEPIGPDGAILYGPPSSRSGSAVWSPGRYALEFRFAYDAFGVSRWLRIDIAPTTPRG
jgi:hypothetical protein